MSNLEADGKPQHKTTLGITNMKAWICPDFRLVQAAGGVILWGIFLGTIWAPYNQLRID